LHYGFVEERNAFARRCGKFRFHNDQITPETSTQSKVAPVMIAGRLWPGRNFQTKIAKAINPVLAIAAPAQSAPAASLPRYFPCRPFPSLLSRSCFSTRVLLAARIAGNARNNPPKLGLIFFAIKAEPAVTSPPSTNRTRYSYHFVRLRPEVLKLTIMEKNSER
jgi:hypothetical protein